MKVHRIAAIAILLAVIMTLSLPAIMAFAIAPPNSISINKVNGYQSQGEDNDQVYLIDFTIAYAAYPTETANEAMIMRMVDPATSAEITSVALYANPLFNDGWGKGAIAFYFSADDVATYGLTFGTAYEFNLIGSPALAWTGTGAPSVTSTVSTFSTTGLSNRIIYLSNQYQSAWGTAIVDSGTLNADGESYWLAIIPNLRTVAPAVFSSSLTPVQYHNRTHGLAYLTTLRNQWIGTWLDLTTVSADWGIGAIWLYSGLWLVVMIGVAFVVVKMESWKNPGISVASFDNKMLLYAEIVTAMFGGLIGFFPYLVAIAGGAIMVLMAVNQVWHRPAY